MALQDLTPQLRTRLGRVERMVGLFLIVTVILMLGGLVYFARHTAKAQGWFTLKVPYYTYIADASGIRVGTPVMMMGFLVGEVTDINTTALSDWERENNFNVFVGFIIRDPYHGHIWTDSRVKLGAGDFLGTRTLEVIRGSGGSVTVVRKDGFPARVLTDRYVWTTNKSLDYVTIAEEPKGFYLTADQEKPLPARLTEIANQVNDALPGLLAMTNQLNSVLGNLTNLTAQLTGTMPKLDGMVGDLRGLVGDLRPALTKPGGLGELILPTNLNTQLTLTLSNFNPGTGPLALTLSNLNSRLTDIGLTLTNVNAQLGQNTNLVADANKLVRDVGSLTTSIETLLKRHWLLRSAFKTNEAKRKK